jgi:histidine triad (HIT) family protein
MRYAVFMNDCIFCKIVRGEIPSEKVYEDETFIAFMDIHPTSPGHVQVIPKEHYRWVWEVPSAGAYFEVVRKIAKAQQKAFSTDWVLSKIVGDEVPHAHIWVFPNKEVAGNAQDFAGNAAKIKTALND